MVNAKMRAQLDLNVRMLRLLVVVERPSKGYPTVLITYQRTRFTLVEILTVVVVIMILASMLLQSVETVRQKGLMAGCLSNLKQQGLATQEYANLNKQTLPPIIPSWTSSGPSKGDGRFWRLLMPYLGRDISTYSIMDYAETEMGVWVCPGQFQLPNVRKNMQYGMNNYDYDPSSSTDEYASGLSGKKMNTIKYHSRIIYIADADPTESAHDIGGVQSRNPTYPWPLTSLSELVHLSGYNALFLDGHAKFRLDEPNHEEWGVTWKAAKK
jgi:prepilin-type processing-associated H-X9-DG protein